MTKDNPGINSCYEKAMHNEPMFVLIGRDPTMLPTIYSWVGFRVLMGQDIQDPQLQEALQVAKQGEAWAKNLGKKLPIEVEAMMTNAIDMMTSALASLKIADTLDEVLTTPQVENLG